MKAHTDLEQSRKLAEILPLESADMNYWCGTQIRIGGYRTMDKDLDVPCWSLAALLDILPDRTCIFKKTYRDGRVKYQGVMEGNRELILKDNPIDTCYEMIIKLYEQKLL